MRGRPCGNKKIQGRKRFILTDVLGLLLALSITEANIGERAGALVVLSKLGNRFSRLKTILADQGFDGVEFIANVKTQFSLVMEVVCQVLGRSRVRVKGFTVLPKPHRRTGWIVERTFAGPPVRLVFISSATLQRLRSQTHSFRGIYLLDDDTNHVPQNS